MPRRPRAELPDGTYHVTVRGAARCPIFVDDDDRLAFLALLADTIARYGWRCHAYCLMGNHYHLVVETTRVKLSSGLHRLNGVYAQRFNARHARSGHLFGERFCARVIESEEHLAAACRYVVENPVRASLCERVDDWRWSGAAECARQRMNSPPLASIVAPVM